MIQRGDGLTQRSRVVFFIFLYTLYVCREHKGCKRLILKVTQFVASQIKCLFFSVVELMLLSRSLSPLFLLSSDFPSIHLFFNNIISFLNLSLLLVPFVPHSFTSSSLVFYSLSSISSFLLPPSFLFSSLPLSSPSSLSLVPVPTPQQ